MTIRPQPRPVRERSEDRLEFARQQPCLIMSHGANLEAVEEHSKVCSWLNRPVSERSCEAHHVRDASNSGTGTKPSDKYSVGLCDVAHKEHDNAGRQTFEAKYGLNLDEQAERTHREYLRTLPGKVIREPRQPRVGLKSAKFQCSCGLEHDVPGSKVRRNRVGVEYRCIRTNTVEKVRLAG